MKSMLRSNIILGIFAVASMVPALAGSSRQSYMGSIEDMYKTHGVLAHVEVIGVRLLNNGIFCYQVRTIKMFKGRGAELGAFTASQKATVGDEYLIVADRAQRPVNGCGGAVNLHSSSGEIFYPIFRSGVLGNGDSWIALKGVALKEIKGSPIVDGGDLCQVSLGTAELMRTCDVFGKIVKWDAVSDILSKARD